MNSPSRLPQDLSFFYHPKQHLSTHLNKNLLQIPDLNNCVTILAILSAAIFAIAVPATLIPDGLVLSVTLGSDSSNATLVDQPRFILRVSATVALVAHRTPLAEFIPNDASSHLFFNSIERAPVLDELSTDFSCFKASQVSSHRIII